VPRRWILWSLFLSSYMPMFILIGLRSIDRANLIAAASGVLILLGALGMLAFILTARTKAAGDYELLDVESRDQDVAAYAATYLLPFLTVFSEDWRDVLSLAAFIGFLGIVYVRSRLIYVNPVLALLGFRLWRVIPVTAGVEGDTSNVPWPRFLLADTEHVRKGQVISARRVTDDLLFFEEDARDDGG
jgi:hypothetical protein